jgi:hypothetical protein
LRSSNLPAPLTSALGHDLANAVRGNASAEAALENAGGAIEDALNLVDTIAPGLLGVAE